MSEQSPITKIEKIDDNHAVAHIMVKGEIAKLRIANGNQVFSGNDEPSIEYKRIKIYTNAEGTIHNVKGPAIENTDTDLKKFFINGTEFTEKEYWKEPSVLNSRKKQINLDED